MIKSITLKNWKSFGEATLYVDPLTVLIGTNASGKSNFLDALVFLKELATGRTVNEALAGTGNGYKGIRGGGESAIRNGYAQASISIDFMIPEVTNVVYRYSISIEENEDFGFIFPEESLSLIQKDAEVRLFTFLKMTHTFLHMDVERWAEGVIKNFPARHQIVEAKKQLTKEMLGLVVIDPIPQNMRSFSKLSRALQPDASNLAGYLAAHPNKENIEQELSIALKELPENEIVKIWSETVGRLETDAMIYCEERWMGETSPKLFDAQTLSDGTLRLIAVLAAILAAEKGSTVVIEEIDNGLHPSRAGLLVNLLKKISTERGVDIICTTHNPALLDAFGLGMLPFIALVYRDPDNGTSQIKNLDEIEHYERIITKGTLGDLITKGRFESALKAS